MRIACVSDLHGKLPKIEICELLIIAGDICPHFCSYYGRPGDINDVCGQAQWLGSVFKDWLDAVPAEEIVAVLGNHDWIGEKRPSLIPNLRWHLLHDSSVFINGLCIYGSPYQPRFMDWAFNLDEPELKKKWDLIPEDTDILIVHGPPYLHGDLTIDGIHTGSPSLLDRIKIIKPRLSVHGHIHSARSVIEYERGDIGKGIIVNASVLDEDYQLVNAPLYFDINVEKKSIV